MGRGGSPVLPARGRAAETGKREAEVEGTAAAMAMAAARRGGNAGDGDW